LPPSRAWHGTSTTVDPGGASSIAANSVAHRDLNPKNNYLADAGDVLILDFGLVKLMDHSSLTMRGQVLGTWITGVACRLH
jgi:serine/threonine protein kinase